MIRPATMLTVDALIEGATGIAIIVAPNIVSRLLFASPLEGAGLIMARIGGIALVCLAVACLGIRDQAAIRAGIAGLLAYNVLSGVVLLLAATGGVYVGILLWPAVVVHLVVAAIFAVLWRSLK